MIVKVTKTHVGVKEERCPKFLMLTLGLGQDYCQAFYMLLNFIPFSRSSTAETFNLIFEQWQLNLREFYGHDYVPGYCSGWSFLWQVKAHQPNKIPVSFPVKTFHRPLWRQSTFRQWEIIGYRWQTSSLLTAAATAKS